MFRWVRPRPCSPTAGATPNALQPAGVEVKIDEFRDMQHVFQLLAGTPPEAKDAIARMAKWVRPRLGLNRNPRNTSGGRA